MAFLLDVAARLLAPLWEGGAAAPPAIAEIEHRADALFRLQALHVDVIERKHPGKLHGRPAQLIKDLLVPVRARPAATPAQRELAAAAQARPIVQLSFRPDIDALPTELLDVGRRLRHLHLPQCALGPELPLSLYRLSDLRELNLNANGIAEFPLGACHIPSLERLLLARNRIERVPAAVGLMGRLFHLRLDSNRLRRLPDAVGRLTRLEGLQLQDNELDALPAALAGCAGLQTLSVARNRLRAVPDLSSLSQLLMLDATDNQLSTQPEWVRRLPRAAVAWTDA